MMYAALTGSLFVAAAVLGVAVIAAMLRGRIGQFRELANYGLGQAMDLREVRFRVARLDVGAPVATVIRPAFTRVDRRPAASRSPLPAAA